MPAQTRSMLKGLIAASPAPEKPEPIITQYGVILLSQNEVDELGILSDPDYLNSQYRRFLTKSQIPKVGSVAMLFSPANNINTYQDFKNSGKEFALAPEGFYWKYVDPTSYYSDMEYWDLQRMPDSKDKPSK